MKRLLLYFLFVLFIPTRSSGQKVLSIKIDGSINPVTADFIHRAIQMAEDKKSSCLLIHLNTPGGLLVSTRAIVTDLLESKVPVVVFVYPPGAHAGSAGVFITMAAHIAAMAPITNIGAAHPVSMGGMPGDSTMAQKATNDAAAFIRSIAAKRNRNLQWAEDAVRKSISISSGEAILFNVIDLIAVNDSDLLKQIDKRRIEINGDSIVLHTSNPAVEQFEMRAIDKLLNIISDPNIAYLVMLLGFYGILFELTSPGAILPGIVGVIALILGFYSMHSLPINYAGLALIIFGICLFLLEIKIVSHGMLAIGGAISLLLGSFMLIDPGSSLETAKISKEVIIAATTFSVLFFLFVLGAGIKAQRQKVVTGMEGLLGATGTVQDALVPNGIVWVQGAAWNAASVSGHINKGEKVKVTGMKKLILYVEPIS